MFIIRALGAGLLLLAVTPLNALQFTTASTTVGLQGDLAIVKSELDQAVVTIRHAACVTAAGAITEECTGAQSENYSDDFTSWHTFDDGCQEAEQWVKGLHYAGPDDNPGISSQSTDACPS